MSSSRSWQSSAETLAAFIEQMPVAVVVADAESGGIALFNGRAEELAQREIGRGALPNGVAGWEIHHLDGRPYEMKEWPLVRALAFGEEVIGEEYFYFLRDGRRATVRCSSGPIYDAERIVAAVLTMMEVRNTSERDQTQTGARRGIETILERITDGFYALDLDWRFTYINGRAADMASRLTGEDLTRENVLGRTLWEVMPALAGTSLEDRLRTAVRDQVGAAFTYAYPLGVPLFDVRAYPSADGLSSISGT